MTGEDIIGPLVISLGLASLWKAGQELVCLWRQAEDNVTKKLQQPKPPLGKIIREFDRLMAEPFENSRS
jgi:hypothetical protein